VPVKSKHLENRRTFEMRPKHRHSWCLTLVPCGNMSLQMRCIINGKPKDAEGSVLKPCFSMCVAWRKACVVEVSGRALLFPNFLRMRFGRLIASRLLTSSAFYDGGYDDDDDVSFTEHDFSHRSRSQITTVQIPRGDFSRVNPHGMRSSLMLAAPQVIDPEP
jgi:hypothetical protein